MLRLKLSAVIVMLISAVNSYSATLLEKVKASGEIVLGVREASGVLSYQVKPGIYSGYHVELCLNIVKSIEKTVGKSLKIKYFEVNSTNRIDLLMDGVIDLECGSTTNNLARQKQVAFANTTFFDYVGVAVLDKSPIQKVSDLIDKKIAITQGTTSASSLVKYIKSNKITIVLGEDHPDGMANLSTKMVDAFVLDRSLLSGLIARAEKPANFRILSEALSIEPIAIAIRKNDPELLKIANSKISELAQSGELTKLYEKWFLKPTPPNNINMNLPMSEQLMQAMKSPNNLAAEKFSLSVKLGVK